MPETGAAWQRIPAPGGLVHLVPVDDLIAHELDACPCGTDVVYTPLDRSVPWRVLHHSLDRRELVDGRPPA